MRRLGYVENERKIVGGKQGRRTRKRGLPLQRIERDSGNKFHDANSNNLHKSN